MGWMDGWMDGLKGAQTQILEILHAGDRHDDRHRITPAHKQHQHAP